MQQYLFKLTERLLSLPDEEESIMTVAVLTAEIILQCPFKSMWLQMHLHCSSFLSINARSHFLTPLILSKVDNTLHIPDPKSELVAELEIWKDC